MSQSKFDIVCTTVAQDNNVHDFDSCVKANSVCWSLVNWYADEPSSITGEIDFNNIKNMQLLSDTSVSADVGFKNGFSPKTFTLEQQPSGTWLITNIN